MTLGACVGFAKRNVTLTVAFAAALLALLGGAVPVRRVAEVVDLRLLALLFAMLVAAELLRLSRVFDIAARTSLGRFTSRRAFTMALTVFAGVLAAMLTNDVALFICIPFTIAATRVSDFDAGAAVMLQIVATNLLGCLSPIGNPQNLYLFRLSGWSATHFVWVMLPFCAVAAAALLVAAMTMEAAGSILVSPPGSAKLRRPLFVVGALALILVVAHVFGVLPIWPAALLALLALPWVLRHDDAHLDLSILPIFFFAFIAVAALRTLPFMAVLGAASELQLYATSIGISQLISNVPATILLAPAATDRIALLLYGVNAAGCGTLIASMANLLGWQIYRRSGGDDPHFLRRFTMLNIVLLVVMSVGGWLVRS